MVWGFDRHGKRGSGKSKLADGASAPGVPARENTMASTPIHPHSRPAANRCLLRFNRHSGFVLGGIIMAAGGCLFGAAMPYQHPVAVTVSVLWWSLFFGCFGAWLGALLGLCAEQTPARAHEPDSADTPAAGRRGVETPVA
jgi:hypothetical protein